MVSDCGFSFSNSSERFFMSPFIVQRWGKSSVIILDELNHHMGNNLLLPYTSEETFDF